MPLMDDNLVNIEFISLTMLDTYYLSPHLFLGSSPKMQTFACGSRFLTSIAAVITPSAILSAHLQISHMCCWCHPV